MSQNSNRKALGWAIALLLGLIVTKAFWVALENFKLPHRGVDNQRGDSLKPLYYHYKLAKKEIKEVKVSKGGKSQKGKNRPKPKPKLQKITKFILKGIYNSKDKKVILVEYMGKSYALSLGEEIEGYKFSDLYPTYAVFTKDGKEYKLELFKEKKESQSSSSSKPNVLTTIPKTAAKSNKIEREGDTTYIPKALFNKYRTNINEIQKNIGVVPNMEGGKLNGFKISYVKKGSDFDKLGVKRGDIILSINGEPLNNFKVPIEFFNNLDSITAATITVKRGNEIKELEYEIR